MFRTMSFDPPLKMKSRDPTHRSAKRTKYFTVFHLVEVWHRNLYFEYGDWVRCNTTDK